MTVTADVVASYPGGRRCRDEGRLGGDLGDDVVGGGTASHDEPVEGVDVHGRRGRLRNVGEVGPHGPGGVEVGEHGRRDRRVDRDLIDVEVEVRPGEARHDGPDGAGHDDRFGQGDRRRTAEPVGAVNRDRRRRRVGVEGFGVEHAGRDHLVGVDAAVGVGDTERDLDPVPDVEGGVRGRVP